MILQALTEYYERLAEQGIVSKPGWSTTKVSDAIVLDFDGQIIGVLPLKEVIIRGTKKMEVSRDCKVPQMVSRSSGIKANFLCDNAKYILGIVEKKKDGKESDKDPSEKKSAISAPTKSPFDTAGQSSDRIGSFKVL